MTQKETYSQCIISIAVVIYDIPCRLRGEENLSDSNER